MDFISKVYFYGRTIIKQLSQVNAKIISKVSEVGENNLDYSDLYFFLLKK